MPVIVRAATYANLPHLTLLEQADDHTDDMEDILGAYSRDPEGITGTNPLATAHSYDDLMSRIAEQKKQVGGGTVVGVPKKGKSSRLRRWWAKFYTSRSNAQFTANNNANNISYKGGEETKTNWIKRASGRI